MPSADSQLLPPFGPVHNSELFSNYWLNNRLPLEPDWHELLREAEGVLTKLRQLWKEQASRVEKYGKEAPLEKAFIQPVLEILGWKLFYQAQIQGRKPDYALFTSDKEYDRALTAGYASADFWPHAAIVADAKAWHISLDKPHRVDGSKEYPPVQMEWYLDRTHVEWGMLTNGKRWRLIPRVIPTGKARFQTYLEVDLPAVLAALDNRGQVDIQGQHVREFLYFYLLFSPSAFVSTRQRAPLIERASLGSSEYALGVSEDLKERVFEALRLSISGFLRLNTNGLSVEADLERCRENSFVLLYRLLFVMYAEDRGLLPYRVNATYTQNRSLARLRDEIASDLDKRGTGIFRADSVDLWKHLLNLFDLVDEGHARYGVPAYNGGLFSTEQHPFLKDNAIGDRELAQIIDKLSRTIDPQNGEAGLFRVDYRDLAIRQLGSVYEGLLEMHPRHAGRPLIIVRSIKSGTNVEKFSPEDEPLPQGFRDTGQRISQGTIYLETDKGERRASGSYYTPDHVVDHIVQNTLGPLCQRIEEEIRTKAQSADHGNFDERVLGLKILDPSMGSGHFLVRACQYLAEEIATSPLTSDIADEIDEQHPTLTFWKRRVAEQCLYGVDVNPLAVELAKLALWLETVSKDQPLAFLDHHLRCGNSLIGTRLSLLDKLPGAPGLFAGLFTKEFSQKRDDMLQPLHQLRGIASTDAAAVKTKEKLLRQYESRAVGFVALADLWTGEFFREDGQAPMTNDEYGDLIRTLGHPKLLKQLLDNREHRLSDIRNKIIPFHWELEFPDAFFDSPASRSPGFDAVIGNPPYDVLASKEVEADLSPLKAFLQKQVEYTPSFKGKNNLYKLFICKGVDVLRAEGYLGYIVPMPLLGDEQAIGIRELIFTAGTFNQIHAFPQKDDAKNRVFPDAKLSTVVFVMLKTTNATKRQQRFAAARHPGREFVAASPKMFIAADEISKYDPGNKTIVSCSQEDWELAVRLMSSSNFCRLGDRCVSFQGEVNETTDGAKGFVAKTDVEGPEILRGANICLYAVREASQGESLFIRKAAYLNGRAKGSKAHHSQERRIGFQRSAPQNNFRRLIAAPIKAGEFCFDTVSYTPESSSKLPLELLLGLLNSKLLEWYFLLGSSNSKVNEYQFNNLPCPVFSKVSAATEEVLLAKLQQTLIVEEWDIAKDLILGANILNPPFSKSLETVIVLLVQKLCEIEDQRGQITRAARAKLDSKAQPVQDLLDTIFFSIAGFSPEDVQGIAARIEGLV